MKKKLAYILVLVFLCSLSFCQTISDTLAIQKNDPIGMTVDQFNLRTGIKNRLVLVNLKADWCVVCIRQEPILDEIKIEKQNKIELIVINMEDNPLIAAYFEVDALPMILLYKNGVLVWTHIGFIEKKQFLEFLRPYE